MVSEDSEVSTNFNANNFYFMIPFTVRFFVFFLSIFSFSFDSGLLLLHFGLLFSFSNFFQLTFLDFSGPSKCKGSQGFIFTNLCGR